MATTLEHPVVSLAGLRARTSARRLADMASAGSIAAARIDADDVELLLNAGLYRDRNLGEPALAALIQEDIGSHPEDPHGGDHGTFSFDVANGGCGVLSALQVADGFLRAGTIRRALVVASDADPGRHMAPAFPFAAVGAAVLCGWEAGTAGLRGFRWDRSTEDVFDAQVGFDGTHNRLHIREHADFAERAALVAAKATQALLADHGLRAGDIDLVVANPLTIAFVETLAAHSGVSAETVVRVDCGARFHTTGLLVGLCAAEEQGRLARAKRTLLVSAGAGIVAGAALLEGRPRRWPDVR